MIIHSTNHRSKNLINKAKLKKQPLTNHPRQVNLPFPLLGMIEWFDEAEAWFKVNERRSNETVDPDKLVPEIEQGNITGRQQYASEMIHGEELFGPCLSTQTCSSWDGQTCVQNTKEIHKHRGTKQERTSEHEGSIPTKYERWI